ncbi:phosphatase PAP2 family protein [Aquimarina agarilytica]|uniref:phosphatase PAP2 family protein n=1 Tax=Aquimarina agarilytica TaxID=1087449 RepID=UPI00028A2FBC|nr:phosphatase PAP2 family protein [Aquimarina agarilytica]
MKLSKLTFFSILFLFYSLFSGHAQSNRKVSNPNLWQDFTYDMGNVFAGGGFAYTRPLHWQKKDFLIFGGVAGSTLLLHTVDDEIRQELRGHRNKVPQLVLDYGWYSGSPQNNFALTSGVYLTGLFTKNEKLRRTGVLLISSAAATGFAQQVAKSVTGRARPIGNLGSNHFKPFGGEVTYRSFPSGHAVLTFTNAHVIAKQFKNPWVKSGIYAIGLVPGITRIYEDAHWASDVFLSWAMSYFMVEAIDIYLNRKYDKKYNSNTNGKKDSLGLSFGAGGIGVTYNF